MNRIFYDKSGKNFVFSEKEIIENALQQEREGINPRFCWYDYQKKKKSRRRDGVLCRCIPGFVLFFAEKMGGWSFWKADKATFVTVDLRDGGYPSLLASHKTAGRLDKMRFFL